MDSFVAEPKRQILAVLPEVGAVDGDVGPEEADASVERLQGARAKAGLIGRERLGIGKRDAGGQEESHRTG